MTGQSRIRRQELPVEGAVPGLRVGHFPGEEGELLPLTAGGLLLRVACINYQGALF